MKRSSKVDRKNLQPKARITKSTDDNNQKERVIDVIEISKNTDNAKDQNGAKPAYGNKTVDKGAIPPSKIIGVKSVKSSHMSGASGKPTVNIEKSKNITLKPSNIRKPADEGDSKKVIPTSKNAAVTFPNLNQAMNELKKIKPTSDYNTIPKVSQFSVPSSVTIKFSNSNQTAERSTENMPKSLNLKASISSIKPNTSKIKTRPQLSSVSNTSNRSVGAFKKKKSPWAVGKRDSLSGFNKELRNRLEMLETQIMGIQDHMGLRSAAGTNQTIQDIECVSCLTTKGIENFDAVMTERYNSKLNNDVDKDDHVERHMKSRPCGGRHTIITPRDRLLNQKWRMSLRLYGLGLTRNGYRRNSVSPRHLR